MLQTISNENICIGRERIYVQAKVRAIYAKPPRLTMNKKDISIYHNINKQVGYLRYSVPRGRDVTTQHLEGKRRA
jgi:hypothetical protein